jgi:plastocyanin
MPKKLLIASIVVVVLIFIAAAVLIGASKDAPTPPSSPTEVVSDRVITLTSDGFSPTELAIKRGETVTFRTTAGKRFWPASNLHPSHALYADFDPKEPVAPDASWSFTFDRTGEWRFHDHLAPYYTGTITVTE